MSNFKIDERGFWFCENQEGHCFDNGLCREIIEILKENKILKIVDFGCGPGKYVKYINDSGFDCIGYDGNPNTPKYTNGVCKVLDLSNTFDLQTKFDCVISLEVGEHIPKQYEEIFINNLTRHTTNLLICSWAVPGQGGDGHVNCQTNGYIIEQISSKNFTLNRALTERIRSTSTLGWFRNTLFVFEKNK